MESQLQKSCLHTFLWSKQDLTGSLATDLLLQKQQILSMLFSHSGHHSDMPIKIVEIK